MLFHVTGLNIPHTLVAMVTLSCGVEKTQTYIQTHQKGDERRSLKPNLQVWRCLEYP